MPHTQEMVSHCWCLFPSSGGRGGGRLLALDLDQYSCLENPLSDREAWQATVYRGV